MTRMLLAFVTMFILGATEARAEWVKVGANDKYVSYIDKATIERGKTSASIWTLRDFFAPYPTTPPSMSEKIQYQLDCKHEMVRSHTLEFYSGSMGSGSKVWSQIDRGEWVMLSPNSPGEKSTGEIVWIAVCGK